MADVMGAFLRGHQAGQEEVAQQQEQAARDLRQMVLKHELSRMKVEDAAKDYQAQFGAAETQYRGLHGQPASNIPSDPVTTQQPNLPSRNLAGVVTGLLQGPPGIDQGSPAPVSSSTPPAQAAASIPAPLAQDQATGTNPVTTNVPRPIAFPGLPAAMNGGTPGQGFSLRPQSAEDIQAATAATEAAKPQKLTPGEIVQQGGRTIAANTTPRVAAAPSPEKVAADALLEKGRNDRAAAANRTRQAVAGAAAAERTRRDQVESDLRQYNTETSRKTAESHLQHAAWENSYKRAAPFGDTRTLDANGQPVGDLIDPATKKPVGEPPALYEPPSFENWQSAKKPAAGAATKPGGGAAPAGKVAQPTDPLQVADPATGRIKVFPNKAAADAVRKGLGL